MITAGKQEDAPFCETSTYGLSAGLMAFVLCLEQGQRGPLQGRTWQDLRTST